MLKDELKSLVPIASEFSLATTVDELVQRYVPCSSINTESESCQYILLFCYDHLLKILKSNNVSSKHDMCLIRLITSGLKSGIERKEVLDAYKEILVVYGNRKELNENKYSFQNSG